jgi:secreted trypsin-like serine protease
VPTDQIGVIGSWERRERRGVTAPLLSGLLVIFFYSATARGEAPRPPVRTQVIGGSPVGTGDFAATGALVRFRGGARQFVCTGTLIAPYVALTAAHCVAGVSGEGLGFSLNEDPATGEREVAVSWTRVHPEFSVSVNPESILHDIALVGLADYFPGVVPESLPREPPMAGASVDLVGYGSMELPASPTRAKNAGRSRIVSVSDSEMQVGARDEPQNCVGDSGGPALGAASEGRVLLGIASRSVTAEAPCVDGTVHTRVDAHLDFIREAQGEPSVPSGCALAPARRASGLVTSCALHAFVALIRRRRLASGSARTARAQSSNPV